MENTKCAQATSRGTLLEQLMNPNITKNERKWTAAENSKFKTTYKIY
jgi:hypothetical protein